jgi:hypothetical protein
MGCRRPAGTPSASSKGDGRAGQAFIAGRVDEGFSGAATQCCWLICAPWELNQRRDLADCAPLMAPARLPGHDVRRHIHRPSTAARSRSRRPSPKPRGVFESTAGQRRSTERRHAVRSGGIGMSGHVTWSSSGIAMGAPDGRPDGAVIVSGHVRAAYDRRWCNDPLLETLLPDTHLALPEWGVRVHQVTH